jgi:nitroimidazol reductase NimA-like FMN-containing flavoprotein (pyridoxamine 5'-phosphate oxidase superfamily)
VTKLTQSRSQFPKTRASRPKMPKDYGIKDANAGSGLMDWARVTDRITGSRNYWIVSTRRDGRPHAMPVWGVWVRDMLLFSTSRASQKGRNIARRPGIVVHLESGDEAVILEGVAVEVTDPMLLAEFTEAYEAKYQFRPDPNEPANVTYALRPRVAFAWLEKDFPGGATRWEFRSEGEKENR